MLCQSQPSHDVGHAAAAEEQAEVGAVAWEMVQELCEGVEEAKTTIGKHIDFWAELHNQMGEQLKQLDLDSLIRPNGKVKVARIMQSMDSWNAIEESYEHYVSAASHTIAAFCVLDRETNVLAG